MQLGSGFTFNPLCEHKPFTEEVPEVRVDGADQDWVRIHNNQYKFIKVSYGVTKFEAEEICRENGGDCSSSCQVTGPHHSSTWQVSLLRSRMRRPEWL